MADLPIMDAWLMGQMHCSQADLPQALRSYQASRLDSLLEYARQTSRFYRAHLPSSSSLCSFSSLPFMDASHLSPWQDVLCVSQNEIERLVTLETSGSSGPPKRLAFTMRDLEATMDFFRAGMGQIVHPGETLLVLLPGADRPFGVADLLRRALSRDGIRVEAGNPLTTPDTLVYELALHAPHAMVAAPRQWQHLLGLSPSLYPQLRGLLSSAEPLPSPLPPLPFLLLDHYGLTESCYGGGVECPFHDGYHLRELDLLVEIVHISTGQPLPPGQVGEIVLTTLKHQAMPLIRYRTGDASLILPGPCACGSPLTRLAPVQGRIIRHGESFTIKPIPKGPFNPRITPTAL